MASIPGFIQPFLDAFHHDQGGVSTETWARESVRNGLFSESVNVSSGSGFNCLSSMDASQLVCGNGKEFIVMDSDTFSPMNTFTLASDIVEVVGGSFEGSGVTLIRDNVGSVYSYRMDSGEFPHRVFSKKASRMCLSIPGEEFAVSHSDTRPSVGVYDLEIPDTCISRFSEFFHRSSGPVLFRDPHSLFYGDRHSVHLVDKRNPNSKPVSFSPPVASISLTSYADHGLDYSCLAYSSDHRLYAYSGSSSVVQLFDVRSPTRLLDEWALPGRGGKSVDFCYFEIFQNGAIISGNGLLEGYFIPSPGRCVSSFETAPSMGQQTKQWNEIETKSVLDTCGTNSKYQRTIRVSRQRMPWEWSIGTVGVGDVIYSITNKGELWRVFGGDCDEKGKFFYPRMKRFITTHPQSELPPESVPLSRLKPTIEFIANWKYAPKALRTYKDKIPPIGLFFVFAIAGLVELRSCVSHRGIVSAKPGSFRWNQCVSRCGFRVVSRIPPRMSGYTRVTTVGETILAFNEMYAAALTVDQVMGLFKNVIANRENFIHHFVRIVEDRDNRMKTALVVTNKISPPLPRLGEFQYVERRADPDVDDDISIVSEDHENVLAVTRQDGEVSRNVVPRLVEFRYPRLWLSRTEMIRVKRAWRWGPIFDETRPVGQKRRRSKTTEPDGDMGGDGSVKLE